MRLIAVLLTITVFNAGQVLGEIEVFFGEDYGPADDYAQLESWPVAESAYSSFLGQIQNVAICDFESNLAGASEPLPINFDGELATLTGRGEICAVANATYAGTYPTSGDQFWLVDNPTAPFTVAFTSPQTSFGFFATDVSDFYGTILLRLNDGREIPVPAYENWPSGSVLFFGIIDDENPFSSITLVPDTVDHGWGESVDGFGIDDIVIGRIQVIEAEPFSFGGVKALFR
jgi:hypothetical protein